MLETADRQQRLTLEQSERSRNDHQAIDRRQGNPPGQKGSQVLDHLERSEVRLRQPDLDDAPVIDLAAVGEANDAADGDGIGVFDERQDHAGEGMLLEHRVSVDHAHQRESGGVEGGVDGVGFAAILLVDGRQVLARNRAVDAAHGLGGDSFVETDRRADQLEVVDDLGQRVVGRSVVDDDHFVLGVVQEHQRPDAVGDVGGLVECGHENGNAGRGRRAHDGAELA